MGRSRKNRGGRPEPPRPAGKPPLPDGPLEPGLAGPAPARPAPSPPGRGAEAATAFTPHEGGSPGASAGGGRAYTVAFGRVWAAAVSVIEQTERWSVVSSDPVRGEILLQIRGLVRRTPRSARIAVWLDEVGLTRLEAVVLDSRGTGPMRRFYRQVEKRLAGGV